MDVRVLLTDRQRIIRQGVRALLEREGLDVVGEAADVKEAVPLAERLKPDVVVLEDYGPTGDGLRAAQLITQACPAVKAIILTNGSRWGDVAAAMRAGVRGYVFTSQQAKDLAHAIRQVARGATYFSRASSLGERTGGRRGRAKQDLSARQIQVLRLIAEGRTTKEIAQILDRSAKTADAHRTRLMEKLDIHEVAGLVRYAIRLGIVRA